MATKQLKNKINFYENKYKIVKKSIYERKYHLEKQSTTYVIITNTYICSW